MAQPSLYSWPIELDSLKYQTKKTELLKWPVEEELASEGRGPIPGNGASAVTVFRLTSHSLLPSPDARARPFL